MSRVYFARLSVVLLLVAVISAPSAWGAPLRQPSGASSVDILAWVWSSIAPTWAKSGANLDPHGLSVNPTPAVDAGCTIDPHGGCEVAQGVSQAPPPTTEAGCTIDPHGVCTPAP